MKTEEQAYRRSASKARVRWPTDSRHASDFYAGDPTSPEGRFAFAAAKFRFAPVRGVEQHFSRIVPFSQIRLR